MTDLFLSAAASGPVTTAKQDVSRIFVDMFRRGQPSLALGMLFPSMRSRTWMDWLLLIRASARTPPEEEVVQTKPELTQTTTVGAPGIAGKDELRSLGYLPVDQSPLFGDTTPQSTNPPKESPGIVSDEMKSALSIMPPKPYTDILVQKFLEEANYNYYCLYPPSFSQDYTAWWADRASSKPLTPAFTCLLLRVCACSAQYLDAEIRQKLESELGEPIQTISENYHHTAKHLSNTIAPGKGGLAQVQQLFLTAAWFKAESLFIESWHTLSACIHEAQELGMHKTSSRTGLTEFDLEMRRRVWCLLYAWDWQMALLLSRPLIINPSCYTFELPNMKLEGLDTETGPPSPVAHIAFQCKLGQMIMQEAPGSMSGTLDAAHAKTIRNVIEEWLVSLPPAYRIRDPYTQWDEEYRFVPLHRLQLHAVGYMTMFLPFKECLTKTFRANLSDAENNHREIAVDTALRLMAICHQLFNHVFPVNAKFHLITFLTFDTAAFLCSAVIHDKNKGLPRREEILQAIKLACSMMGKLARATKTRAICYPILTRLAKSCSAVPAEKTSLPNVQDGELRTGTVEAGDLGDLSFDDIISPESLSGLDSISAPGIFTPADLPVPGLDTPPMMALGDWYNVDVGQLDQIWDWQNLDLTLLPFPPS
ncbi:hypothetical protein N7510_004664 [Penicillium lagena]|uniref:uncharacterized protein n=1 Tax=Penicillium lagena TaxID=94218 RepID=UPI00253F8534|nr:uncharacterized protein N7510_004664 [Penicillium lagena]KAJ5620680.1 hypothetical protein N7510_004664 [Penicillium lagena]